MIRSARHMNKWFRWIGLAVSGRYSLIIPYIQLFIEYSRTTLDRGMAEGAGFEPAVRVNAHTLSKRAP